MAVLADVGDRRNCAFVELENTRSRTHARAHQSQTPRIAVVVVVADELRCHGWWMALRLCYAFAHRAPVAR